jgi:hypothetical protein
MALMTPQATFRVVVVRADGARLLIPSNVSQEGPMQIRSFRVSEVISENNRVRVRVDCWLDDRQTQRVFAGTDLHSAFETYTYDYRGTASCRFAHMTGFTVGETGVKSWEKENGQSLDSSSLRDFIWNVGAKGRG